METPNFEKEALAAEFKKYVEDLRLDPEKLCDQKIADIGCGENAEFVRAALENGIENIVGVDISFRNDLAGDSKLKDHLINKGAEDVKLHNMDLIVAYASIGSHPDIDLPKTFDNLTSGLNPAGELRIYPISDSETLKGIQRKRKEVENALQSLPEGEFEIEFVKGEEQELPSGEKFTDDLLIVTRK
ncbi:MAG: class I SAM-dependent methyltransferase [Patescibacteria group bacterium]|nr:class I SAM-dependent methyltransferase [Patescibacteria group bacterium]